MVRDAGERSFDLLGGRRRHQRCGIARDAAGRGLKVLLVEKDDLASAHLVLRRPSSSTAACAISSITSSGWSARR